MLKIKVRGRRFNPRDVEDWWLSRGYNFEYHEDLGSTFALEEIFPYLQWLERQEMVAVDEVHLIYQ